MRRSLRWVRPVSGAAIVGVLLWRLDAAPLLEALSRIDGWSLAAAGGLAVVVTVCCAWRWVLVARGLGVALSLRSAVAACYRSQFLNVALPGGVFGDVHRGMRHGRDVEDVGRGVRSVVWERVVGQAVQLMVAVPVLLMLPSPVRPALPIVGLVVLVVLIGLALLLGALAAAALPRRTARTPALIARTLRTAGGDLRRAVLRRQTWPGAVGASGVAVVGHVATFVLAARIAGSTAPTLRLVPLALLVLLAMGLPLSAAGWGPREGMAAWSFGAAGFGVEQGVAVAVVYGVLVLAAALPGAGLLLFARHDARVRVHG
jgi:uncharacterized membrane protein YbhN (UPF0104 family)